MENYSETEKQIIISRHLDSLSPSICILDFTGLQLTTMPCILKFQNLVELRLDDNNFTNLPPFPHGITRIYCSNNKLRSLPPLPQGLRVLDCSNNPDLKTLPFYGKDLQINIENTSIDLNIYKGMSKTIYNLMHN